MQANKSFFCFLQQDECSGARRKIFYYAEHAAKGSFPQIDNKNRLCSKGLQSPFLAKLIITKR